MTPNEIELAKLIQMLSDKENIPYQEAAAQIIMLFEDVTAMYLELS